MQTSESAASRIVLLVDNEAPLRRALTRLLRRAGHRTHDAATLEEGRRVLIENEVDIAFIDIGLPKSPNGSGLQLCHWALAKQRAHAVYGMTSYPRRLAANKDKIDSDVEILEKPFDVAHMMALVDKGPNRRRTKEPESFDTWRKRYAPSIVGEDSQLVEALKITRTVAETDCTVLITGESGTGKELLARALHKSSKRASGPFVALNCAAIPDSMVEAELFGHARGSFTGAHASRQGRVATAEGGTLFLDEIGDMPLAAQAKLLRMLEEHTIMPVGSDSPLTIDVRILAATNQDLEAMVKEGRFRGDLYYRLRVIPIELPPLRERGDDVVRLAQMFLDTANQRNGCNISGFDASAERMLTSHYWPGNARELLHLIERTVIFKKSGRIGASDLNLRISARGTGGHRVLNVISSDVFDGRDLRSTMEEVERRLIDEALERTGGNRTEAAALLGVNRTTLVEKIRKHNS